MEYIFIIAVLASLPTSFIYVISAFVSINWFFFSSHYRLYFPASLHVWYFLLDTRHCESYVLRSWRFLNSREHFGLSSGTSLFETIGFEDFFQSFVRWVHNRLQSQVILVLTAETTPFWGPLDALYIKRLSLGWGKHEQFLLALCEL